MNALVLIMLSMIGQLYVEPNCPNCINGVCVMPTYAVQVKAPIKKENPHPTYAWKQWMDGRYLLQREGVIIGQYHAGDQLYYPFDGVKNLPAVKPPIDPPNGRDAFAENNLYAEWQVNGVGARNFSDSEVLTFGGKVIPKTKMSAAFEGKLTDDSDKGYMIIIAKDESKRNKVLQDYQKLPEEFRARYHLWMADPSHFLMQDRYNGKPRFVAEGDPTVVLQNNKGEVMFRRPQAGQVYQQRDMQDLLKSDPSYNPALDPGAPAKTFTDYLPKLSAQTWGVLGFGVLVGVVALKRKKDENGPATASVLA